MNLPLAPLDVLLPQPCGAQHDWAARELLARMRLPWKLHPSAQGLPRLALAIGCPLPAGVGGVEVLARPETPIRVSKTPPHGVTTNAACGGSPLAANLAQGRFAQTNVAVLGPGRIRLAVDLPAEFDDWLGRREERSPGEWYVSHTRGRLASLTGRIAPVAELLAEAVLCSLRDSAGQFGLELPARAPLWPKGKEFAVHLSHDVDVLGGRYMLWRRYASWAARAAFGAITGRMDKARRSVAKIRRYLATSDDPHYTIPRITELEGRYGATSSFYFFCSSNRRTLGRRAGRMYRLRDPLARDAIRRIVQAGSEAGVHAFPNDRLSVKALVGRKALLEEVLQGPVAGIRQHYLAATIPGTWIAQNHAGFKYDASLGWNDHFGLRAGTCVPYRLWDSQAGAALDLMEIPLCVMDGAIASLHRDPAQWMEAIGSLVEAVRNAGGVLSLLVHPDQFDEVDFPGVGRFYEEFLKEMSRRGGWLTSGANIWRTMMEHRRTIEMK